LENIEMEREKERKRRRWDIKCREKKSEVRRILKKLRKDKRGGE